MLAIVFAAIATSACSNARPQKPLVSGESDKDRFPHQKHVQIKCTQCHAASDVKAGKPAQPGDRHTSCDQQRCHQKEFASAPGPLCRICHQTVDAAGSKASPAVYPPSRGGRALAAEFSHAQHLSYATMERQVGFHVSCTDCHSFGNKGGLSRPGHTVCARCHAKEAAPDKAPPMGQCSRCHKARSPKPARTRQFIGNDVRFGHGNHRVDRRGKLIACAECHPKSAQTARTAAHPKPTTRACVTCHDDRNRVSVGQRMRVCQTCHTGRSLTFSSLPPRSHFPPRERPKNHTLAFRRDHAADARANSQKCAGCHTFMSGNHRDTCDDCHQVMRPRSHNVLWRDFNHGAEAATQSNSCATCHSGDFCTSCHQKRPRSHFPLLSFRTGGHGSLASFSMRSCTTCHVVQRFCTTAGCHVTRPR